MISDEPPRAIPLLADAVAVEAAAVDVADKQRITDVAAAAGTVVVAALAPASDRNDIPLRVLRNIYLMSHYETHKYHIMISSVVYVVYHH
jgi:hypothetical protein